MMKKASKKPTKAGSKTGAQKRSRAAYFKQYNKIRNERYQNDPEYRERVIEQERERYKRRHPDRADKGFGENAGRARDYAQPLKVLDENDEVSTLPALSVENMANFLNSPAKVLRDWIRSGKFPEPNKKSKCGKRIYTIDEANALAVVLNKHLGDRAAFRPTDTDAIEELNATYNAIQ